MHAKALSGFHSPLKNGCLTLKSHLLPIRQKRAAPHHSHHHHRQLSAGRQQQWRCIAAQAIMSPVFGQSVVQPATGKQSAVVFILHGLGEQGLLCPCYLQQLVADASPLPLGFVVQVVAGLQHDGCAVVTRVSLHSRRRFRTRAVEHRARAEAAACEVHLSHSTAGMLTSSSRTPMLWRISVEHAGAAIIKHSIIFLMT